MSNGRKILEAIMDANEEEEFRKADGFDDAVIGYDAESGRLIYSVKKCISILEKDGMSEDDAIEYFDYNVAGSYVGEKTPIWCDDNFYIL